MQRPDDQTRLKIEFVLVGLVVVGGLLWGLASLFV